MNRSYTLTVFATSLRTGLTVTGKLPYSGLLSDAENTAKLWVAGRPGFIYRDSKVS